MATQIQLYQFPNKASPVPADLLYLADSGNSFDEVQSTIAEVIGAYPTLLTLGGITLGTGVATALSANVNGSGSMALTTSPVFVTPTLGAALATSINFGGSTFSNYVSESSWTPGFTFATAGNLSVSYATQTGTYTRIGSCVFITFTLTCTPTYTTSSGAGYITGLPFNAEQNYNFIDIITTSLTPTYGTGNSSIRGYTNIGNNSLLLLSYGSASNPIDPGVSNFVTGTAFTIYGSGFYFV